MSSRGRGIPPLQRRTQNPFEHANLTSVDLASLDLQIIDLFGYNAKASDAVNATNMEGMSHWEVGEMEALAHIHLWSHPARSWRKVGGDHGVGRPRKDGLNGIGRRCTRILVSTVPIDEEHYVWNVDHTAECKQSMNKRLQTSASESTR